MPYDVRYHWQAEAALSSLPPQERDRVAAAVRRLQTEEFRRIPDVRRLNGIGGSGELYVLRVGDELRVMFTVEPSGVISVQDIINRQFAQRYG